MRDDTGAGADFNVFPRILFFRSLGFRLDLTASGVVGLEATNLAFAVDCEASGILGFEDRGFEVTDFDGKDC